MTRGLVAIAALGLTAALAANAVALHFCDDPPEVDLGHAYLVVDEIVGVMPAHGDTLWTFWVYAESNGEPGLQRGGCGGPVDCITGQRDWCETTPNPDTIIF